MSNELVETTAAPVPAVASPLEVLSVSAVELNDGMYTAPTSGDATTIAKELAKVFYPVKLGILSVPVTLQGILNAVGEESEELLPISALKARILVRQMTNGVTAREAASQDVLLQELPAAIAKSSMFISEFETFVAVLLGRLREIRDQFAGPKAFYAAQTSGRRLPVDVPAVQTVLLNSVAELNRMASGYKGYQILALVNHVAAIGGLLNADDLKIPGVPTKAALLNKLNFRITPVHAAAHTALVNFFGNIERAEDPSLSSDAAYDILIAAMNLERHIDAVQNYGGTPASKKLTW